MDIFSDGLELYGFSYFIYGVNSQALAQSILELKATYPFFTNAAATHSEVNDHKEKSSEKREDRGVGRVEKSANLEVRSPPHRLQPHSYILFFLLSLVGGLERSLFQGEANNTKHYFSLKRTTPEATSLGHLFSIIFFLT